MYTKCRMCTTGDVFEHICVHCDSPCTGSAADGTACRCCVRTVLYVEPGGTRLGKDMYEDLATLWIHLSQWSYLSYSEALQGAAWYWKPRH